MTKKKRRAMRWVIEIGIILLIFVAISIYNSRGTTRGLAPEISGQLLDGTPVSLEAMRGSPVLVQFWATWCPVCGVEQSTIDAIAKDYPLLSVAVEDSTPEQILAYMKDRGVDYPVIHDPDYHIAERYGVRGFPSSFIIDARGYIRFVETGYTSSAGLRLRLWWAGRSVE